MSKLEIVEIDFEPWGHTMPPNRDFYYFDNGVMISQEEYDKREFGEMLFKNSSMTHVMHLTVDEVIERFKETLTEKQIKYLRQREENVPLGNHDKNGEGGMFSKIFLSPEAYKDFSDAVMEEAKRLNIKIEDEPNTKGA